MPLHDKPCTLTDAITQFARPAVTVHPLADPISRFDVAFCSLGCRPDPDASRY
jgi:hypothetical protein